MEFLGLPWEIVFVYALIVGVFAAFVYERFPPDITAMGAFVLLIMVGIIGHDDALRVFGNPAPITIGAMFIMSAALERTGCIQILGHFIGKAGGKSQFSLMLIVMPIVLIVSALMNNTPVVIILTPVLISLARKMEMASSKILIPLSYAAVLGGSMTMIGTSTNILVNGIVTDYGLPAFNMFSITLPGLILAAVGFVYMFLFGRFLLPDRSSFSGMIKDSENKKFITRVVVPPTSDLIDKEIQDILMFKGEHTMIIDILRHGDSMYDNHEGKLDEIRIKEGDRIIIESTAGEILGMKEQGNFVFDHVGSHTPQSDNKRDESENMDDAADMEETILVEGVVSNDSNLRGKYVSGLKFRGQYGVYVVGVNKIENRFLGKTAGNVLETGDAILLEGPVTGMRELFRENGLVNLTVPEDRPIRRDKAPIAILTLLAVVFLAAINVLPIVLLAMVGAGIVVLTRCVDARDIYKTIDWSILFLIFGMLGVATAMESTGATQLFVDQVVSMVDGYGPIVLLAAFYILTSFLTEVVSNNAVAALLAPIAIGVAHTMGINPEPLLVAVMFGASASFATPIGYQTNTFVYVAGGYRFMDFIRVGLPMNIIIFLTAIIVIPMFWEF